MVSQIQDLQVDPLTNHFIVFDILKQIRSNDSDD